MNSNTYINLFSSAIGTGIAEIITLPICTVKTVYQNNLEYRSFLQITNHIYRSQGILGFYNAFYSAIISQMLSASLKYTFYQKLKKYNPTNKYIDNAFYAIVSNLTASLIIHPIEVIKINQQLGMFQLNKYINSSINQWYKGYSKTITKNIIGAVTFMPLYDKFNEYFKCAIVASFWASVTATIILHPIDLFKTRHIGNQQYIYNCNIYRGLGLNLARIVPHFTISMTIIEKIKNLI